MKTAISSLIVAAYILCCFRLRTAPWRYFQINARYFSGDKGIFSKINIDSLIPEKWKLRQDWLVDGFEPIRYPVFVKPEWGQNAKGIQRADNETELQTITKGLNGSATRFIAQEGALEKREFEIFFVYPEPDRQSASIVTVTEVINESHEYPINSVYNEDTTYHDISNQFTEEELKQLAEYNKEIGHFGHSRLSVRAHSLPDLIAGKFHVIELNLFTPMPVNVLDQNLSALDALKFIGSVSWELARTTRSIDANQPVHPVFTRMMSYNRHHKTASVLRSFL